MNYLALLAIPIAISFLLGWCLGVFMIWHSFWSKDGLIRKNGKTYQLRDIKTGKTYIPSKYRFEGED